MAAGTTKSELPRRGDVLRYVYLFHRESRDRDDGVKVRAVVVIVADHAYFARIEAIARGRILEALDIEAHLSAEMPEALRARILANLPSAEEIASGRWNDED